MRAALYARVSTSNNGQSPEMQLRELREYCERRGWTITAEYVDVGISGTRKSGPNWTRCLLTRGTADSRQSSSTATIDSLAASGNW